MKLTEEYVLNQIRKKTARPLKLAELMKALAITEPRRREFRSLLKSLVAEGRLVKLRGGRFGMPDEMNLVSGTLKCHPGGFGFVVTEPPGEEPDIYIGKTWMEDAMHGDRVTVRIESYHKGPDKPEGRVIRVLKRNTASLIGTYEPFKQGGWVVPLDEKYLHDIFIAARDKGRARPGQVVVVEIDTYPTRRQPPTGRVTEVLGDASDPEVEVRSILRKHGVARDFSPKVMKEAQQAAAKLDRLEEEGRVDLSDELTLTIDPERAKDYDDAVSIETLEGGGYRLGVHIADVSHFIPENSALDREAFERGTSVYYADGVVPMLPFPLSNEACSLKPGVRRLAVTVRIDFDAEGNALQWRFFPSIIVSKRRLTYNEAWTLMDKGDPEKSHGDVLPALQTMHRLSRILRKRRLRSLSVNFNLPERQVTLDGKGRVTRITIAEHNEAHELIEEFMLAANQAAAQFLGERNVPLIHRIHEKPDVDKLEHFNEFILSFGLRLPSTSHVSSQDLQALLQKVAHRPEERTINTLMLRTMKKARYSVKDPGHFALGFRHYAHFTSPIRRYPDLVIHRQVKAFLKKRKCSDRMRKALLPGAEKAAEQSSMREERAQEIEREISDLRAAQFMADKVGQSFTGLIVGVTAFGFFVELNEAFVEGLVRISSLTDDYYLYLEAEHRLVGQRRHRIFKIGDRVEVKVTEVDIGRRQIGFTWLKTL